MSQPSHQLPAAGKTSKAQRLRIDEPDATGTALTISEASSLYKVSERILRRDLGEGRISGAHKVPGLRGEEWRLPIAGLEATYQRREEANATPAPIEPDLITELRLQRDDLKAELAAIKAELERMTSRALAAGDANASELEKRVRAETERDLIATQKDTLATELDDLKTQLENLRSRRWWQRR